MTDLGSDKKSVEALERFRRAMPVTERWAYFDNAAVAPIPAPAREAMLRWAEQAAAQGDVPWKEWEERSDRVRSLGAEMIGADETEIALVGSTSEGVNLVSEGFPWREGDNIVTLADEFPTNQYPWLNQASRGVETRRVPTDGGVPDLDRVAAAIDDRTRIVSVSWVSFSSGWRNDLDRWAELAHARGALLFVDAIQGLGVFPLDVRTTPIDFLSADGHKWMLGPEGAGIFYCRQEHLAKLRPMGIGWNSVVGCHDFSNIDFNLKRSASRYEGGSRNMVGMIGLAASLELLASVGFDVISRRVVEVTDYACRRLGEIGATLRTVRTPGHESGIVMFELPGVDPNRVREACLSRGVVMSCRGGRLRISAHAYNNEGDIDRAIEALEALR